MSTPRSKKPSFFKPSLTDEKSSLSTSIWYQQEQEEESENATKILRVFWAEKIIKKDMNSINGFKGFIIGELFKNDPANQEKVNQLFNQAINQEIDFDTFCLEIQKFGFKYIYVMNNFEKLVSLDQSQSQYLSYTIDATDIKNLQDYMRDKKISGAISLRTDAGDLVTPEFKENKSSSSFPMHSVGKIFTGMLVFIMIKKGILSEIDLNKPIQLDKKVLEKLSPAVQKQLKEVTLHQCMTHHAGLGDYLENYEEHLKTGKIPEMKTVEDFLPFAQKEAFPIGEKRYSNLGFLLVGLAIQHAYEKHIGRPCDYTQDILKKFIINEADISSFSTHKPENGLTNPSDLAAPHIVGSPAGGYWTTVEDLAKFGVWINSQFTDPEMKNLIEKYGEEFYNTQSRVIMHEGRIPSASACLIACPETGAVCASLSNQPDVAIDLNLRVQKSLYSDNSLDISDEEMARVLSVQQRMK